MTWKHVFYSGRMPAGTDIDVVAKTASLYGAYNFFAFNGDIYFLHTPGMYYKTGLKSAQLDVHPPKAGDANR
jgi:hypothetical protein